MKLKKTLKAPISDKRLLSKVQQLFGKFKKNTITTLSDKFPMIRLPHLGKKTYIPMSIIFLLLITNLQNAQGQSNKYPRRGFAAGAYTSHFDKTGPDNHEINGIEGGFTYASIGEARDLHTKALLGHTKYDSQNTTTHLSISGGVNLYPYSAIDGGYDYGAAEDEGLTGYIGGDGGLELGKGMDKIYNNEYSYAAPFIEAHTGLNYNFNDEQNLSLEIYWKQFLSDNTDGRKRNTTNTNKLGGNDFTIGMRISYILEGIAK